MKSQSDASPLLVFGAHPDDIEFGCGGIIAREAHAGRTAHFVVCSKGESASHGAPEQRVTEAQNSAKVLRAELEFLELGGDAHFEISTAHTIRLAEVIRRIRPELVLAPSPEENQHPDHSRLGKMVREAARLARYAGLKELKALPAHSIRLLLFFAITPETQPSGINPIYIDISVLEVFNAWVSAMKLHASQTSSLSYVDLQVAQARVNGLRAGVEYATALYPSEPLLFDSLQDFQRSLRRF